jgi:hypothetical protein
MVSRGVLEDRKRDMLSSIGTRLSPNQEESIRQVIECGPEILDHIAREDSNGRRDGPAAGEIINQLSRLRIALGFDFVWCGLARSDTEKLSDIKIQIVEVLIGPF